MSTYRLSNELEAFLEYITITKALSKKSIEAYRGDLTFIENKLQKPLINIGSSSLFQLLLTYTNKRTLNRKLSSINSFFDFCYKSQFMDEKTKLNLQKFQSCFQNFSLLRRLKQGYLLLIEVAWLD